MYAQSFLVSFERGKGCDPTMAASLSSGWTGFMKAGFGLRFDGFFLEVLFLLFGISDGIISGLN